MKKTISLFPAVVLCNIYGYVTGDVTGSEPEKPTTPVVTEKPTGAVGERYDTTKYDVPADADKDGWITEAEVQAVLNQLRAEYPDGSEWGPTTWYPGLPNGAGMGSGTACQGFAKKDVFEGVNYPDSYTTVDGNFDPGIVLWGMANYYDEWPAGAPGTHIWSRYPAERGPFCKGAPGEAGWGLYFGKAKMCEANKGSEIAKASEPLFISYFRSAKDNPQSAFG